MASSNMPYYSSEDDSRRAQGAKAPSAEPQQGAQAWRPVQPASPSAAATVAARPRWGRVALWAIGAVVVLFVVLAFVCQMATGGFASTVRYTAADYQERLLQQQAGEAPWDGEGAVFEFTDSAGRVVALPCDMERIVPSGSYAQLLLATLCPDKMVALSGTLSAGQLAYFPSRLSELPSVGSLYGSNGTLNKEQVIRLAPDVIIDIGEPKENIVSDLDDIQEQTGIPVIYIEATMPHIAEAYRTLGQVTGSEERAAQLADYVQGVLDFAEEHQAEVAERDVRLLYTGGVYGYRVTEKGSVHSGAIDIVGLNNVADLGGFNSNDVSPEQVLVWQPDVVLISPTAGGLFKKIDRIDTWQQVSAIENDYYYEVPRGPYEWLDQPPSVQTVLGVLWVGNLLVPDIYDFDMVEKAQEFYRLFWGYDLTDDEAGQLLANSTLKAQGQAAFPWQEGDANRLADPEIMPVPFGLRQQLQDYLAEKYGLAEGDYEVTQVQTLWTPWNSGMEGESAPTENAGYLFNVYCQGENRTVHLVPEDSYYAPLFGYQLGGADDFEVAKVEEVFADQLREAFPEAEAMEVTASGISTTYLGEALLMDGRFDPADPLGACPNGEIGQRVILRVSFPELAPVTWPMMEERLRETLSLARCDYRPVTVVVELSTTTYEWCNDSTIVWEDGTPTLY